MSNENPTGRTNEQTNPEASKQGNQRTKSRLYPRYNLRRAEELAKATFDEGPWRVDQDNVAGKVGYSNAGNGAYKSLRATANYFDMIRIETDGSLSVTDEWIKVFEADDPDVIKRARQTAMSRPTLYQQLIDEFKDAQLPTLEKLAQRLFLNPQKYGITKDAADVAAKAFFESATYAGMIDDKRRLRATHAATQDASDPDEDDNTSFQQRTDDRSSKQGQFAAMPVGEGVSQAGLVRQEVPLRQGKVAYLIVPRRLSTKDKNRLKQYIDLILDEDEDDDEMYEGEV